MTTGDDEVSAYFARIGYRGSREPTLAALRDIVFAHATAIPFENLDVLLGRPIALDAAALFDKLVRRRRGGYCFEHNRLLCDALQALGFDVVGLAARVLWDQPEGALTRRGHMLLRVALPEGDFIADVGFGGLTLTGPLRLVAGTEQETPHEPHRLLAADQDFELQVRLDREWRPLYRFDLQPQLPLDYDMPNWFASTHPRSRFLSELMCARPDQGRRYALHNSDLTVRHRDGVERRQLTDAAELHDVLTRDFRMTVTDADSDAVWRRIRK